MRIGLLSFLIVCLPGWQLAARDARQGGGAKAALPLFATSDKCLSCHNGLVTPAGEDVSIGADWRASMMANSARDPYWQAAVRREVLDHPTARAAIEHECAACHMPMSRYEAKVSGARGEVFTHLPVGSGSARPDLLAADGVSCTACHQIQSDGLGTRESFTAGFVIDTSQPMGGRSIFGPFEVDKGRARIMHSASDFRPARASHLESSEFCASCHTLFTHALDPDGQVIGELPEQVPYLEWRHSEYRAAMSCQACHMAKVKQETPVSAVLGQPRPGLSRHQFNGGNFFMLSILNRFRDQLGVTATAKELDSTIRRTVQHLQTESAHLSITAPKVSAGRLEAVVEIGNLAGHKLPTAYPSRRAWIHFLVRDSGGSVVFESGRVSPEGLIRENDNDADPARFEPHYETIERTEQVQIYEAIMVDARQAVTTGLLSAVRFVKDNRLLPRGFDKTTAAADVAVHGGAVTDSDFSGGGDRVRYSVVLGGAAGPFRVEAKLMFQPIGYRWARNLVRPGVAEMERFTSLYETMAPSSAVTLAESAVTVAPISEMALADGWVSH